MKRNYSFALIGLAAVAALVLGIAIDFSSPKPPAPATGAELTRVVFATDWKAQAEHGGYYQAKALGLYEKAGLDVEIRMGGPSVNIPQLIAAGAIDFGLGSNHFIVMNLATAEVPAKAVAACFQKDPQVLIAHPRPDVKSIADIAGKPVMVADATIGSFWVWLRAKHGYTDDQIRKYTFNLAPFLSDPLAIQQGYLTSEPYTIEKEAGIKPQVFLLADAGYPGYGGFVLARDGLIAERPEIVRAFVAASIEGWRSYLEEDPAPANRLILADNPEMSADIIAQAIGKLKENNIVQPDGAGPDAICQMTEDRLQGFLKEMSALGLYPADLDLSKAFSTQFLPQPEPAAPAP